MYEYLKASSRIRSAELAIRRASINRILQKHKLSNSPTFKPCSLRTLEEELGFVRTFLFEFKSIQDVLIKISWIDEDLKVILDKSNFKRYHEDKIT